MQYFSITKLKNDNRIESEIRLPLSGGEWKQTARLTNETQTLKDGGVRTTAVLSVSRDVPQKSAVRLVTQKTDWDTGNYVFAPAALYNGNRLGRRLHEHAVGTALRQ